jgi:hypothetical protein
MASPPHRAPPSLNVVVPGNLVPGLRAAARQRPMADQQDNRDDRNTQKLALDVLKIVSEQPSLAKAILDE